MLHRMSEVRGWHHEEMMDMSQPLFYRYYGYWYQDRLQEDREHKRRTAEDNARKNPKQLDSGQIGAT
jgi:hypothetical protein